MTATSRLAYVNSRGIQKAAELRRYPSGWVVQSADAILASGATSEECMADWARALVALDEANARIRDIRAQALAAAD